VALPANLTAASCRTYACVKSVITIEILITRLGVHICLLGDQNGRKIMVSPSTDIARLTHFIISKKLWACLVLHTFFQFFISYTPHLDLRFLWSSSKEKNVTWHKSFSQWIHTYVVGVFNKILVTMSTCPGACFTPPQEKKCRWKIRPLVFYLTLFALELLLAGLPDGLFSNPKSQFG
jgi:hypothetical protein